MPTRPPRFFDLETLYQTQIVLEMNAAIRLYGAADVTERQERLAPTIRDTANDGAKAKTQTLLQGLLGVAKRSAVNASGEACSARMVMSAWMRQA